MPINPRSEYQSQLREAVHFLGQAARRLGSVGLYDMSVADIWTSIDQIKAALAAEPARAPVSFNGHDVVCDDGSIWYRHYDKMPGKGVPWEWREDTPIPGTLAAARAAAAKLTPKEG